MDNPGDPANNEWWNQYDMETYGHTRSYESRYYDWIDMMQSQNMDLVDAIDMNPDGSYHRTRRPASDVDREERRQEKILRQRQKAQEKLNAEPSLRGSTSSDPPVFDGHKKTHGLRGVREARIEETIRRLGIYMPTRVSTIQQPPFLMSELPSAAPSLAQADQPVKPDLATSVASLNGTMVAAQAQMMAQMAATLKKIASAKKPRSRKAYRRPKIVYRKARRSYRRSRYRRYRKRY